MIGALAHLGARALDTVRSEVEEARRVFGWGLVFAALGRGTPDPSEVELADLRSALSSSRGRFATLKVLFDARGADLVEAERDLDAADAEIKALGAECDQLRDERDKARASLRELGGLLSGIAHRMTDDEAELALVEMAEASARLARGEAAAKSLVELRAAASGLVAAEDQYQRAISAGGGSAGPLPLASWFEGEEAWDRLVKALGAPHG